MGSSPLSKRSKRNSNSNSNHKYDPLSAKEDRPEHSPQTNKILTVLEIGFPLLAILICWLGPQNILDWTTAANDAASEFAQETNEYLASLEPYSQIKGDLEDALQYPTCRFVMSESAVPNGGWGVFALTKIQPNEKILHSDARIHLVDLQSHHYDGIKNVLQYYAWSPKYGYVEGTEVQTIAPGLGMLANGWNSQLEAVPGKPDMAEPGPNVVRGTATAGSFTYYHNRQFWARRTVSPGDEILVNYGADYTKVKLNGIENDVPREGLHRSMADLKENGLCLDNIANAQAGVLGRGAFATRFLRRGTFVAPLPVLPVNRTSLDMDDKGKKQLFLNYCFGHKDSSLLLYPYAPVTNYINSVHHGEEPNAEVRWSKRTMELENSHKMSAQEILNSFRWGLLLEVVALRDIRPGEQILIDYGHAWHQAWSQYVRLFNDTTNRFADNNKDQPHVYASRMNQLATIRTEDEQERYPYPHNIEISCMYQYAEHKHYDQWPYSFDKRNKVTHAEWTSKQQLVPNFLRPCRILERENSKYTVEIKNPWSSAVGAEGRIPRGIRHVVTKMPRSAIQFTDRRYSSDQHLPGVFRHEIGLPEGVFPSAWMDLAN